MIAMHLEARRKQMVVNRQAAIKRILQNQESQRLCAQTDKLPKARSSNLDDDADPCSDMFERFRFQNRRNSDEPDEDLNKRYEVVRRHGLNPKLWRRFSSVDYSQQH